MFAFRRLVSRLAFLWVAVFALAAADGPLTAAPSPTRLGLDADVPATIDVSPITERWRGDGFMPIRVRIENRGREPLAWNFGFTVNFGYTGHTLYHEQRLGAGAGEVMETVVFVPGAGELPNNWRASITIVLSGPGTVGFGGSLLHGNNESVLITATTAALEGHLLTVTHGAPGPRTEITTVEPGRWPADWRVWSPFERVVLDERAYGALDAARRGSLLDWVAMGGTLDLYPVESGGAPREPLRRHGHGEIRAMAKPLAVEAASISGGSPPTAVNLVRHRFRELPGSLGAHPSVERRDELNPVHGALGVSIFLIIFGILVGPVNLFVLAPSGRRHRLFFTLPAISLGASALLAGYIVVKDGFGGEGVRNGLVLLLPETNQAVLSQTQIARTGVLLGADFTLPHDATLTHQNISRGGHHHHGHDERSQSYRRDPERAGGDWFTSRRVQEHYVRRLVPTRARVELVAGGENDQPPVVQSSVGTVLRDFRYTDAYGRAWGAAEVAPGQRVTLRPDFALMGQHRGLFTALGGAAEGLAPLDTLEAIRWDAPLFLYAGPLVGARTP
jgi:hypothetical protein